MKKQKKEYKFNCHKCGKQYTVLLSQNDYNKGRYKKNCSLSCANSKKHSQQTKRKIRQSCKNNPKIIQSTKKARKARWEKHTPKPIIIKNCKFCGKQFSGYANRKYCSHNCHNQYLRTINGRKNKSNIIKQTYINGRLPAGGYCEYIEVDTSIGKFKVQGSYQVRMCKILDKLKELNQIKDWEYTNDKFQYIAEDNKQHIYFLDFKVFNNDGSFKYIQTKGFQRQRDSYKWNAVRQKGFQLEVCFDQQIKWYQKKYIKEL